MKKEDIYIISTAYEKKEDAVEMARFFINNKLISCGQIFPNVESLYLWDGKLQQEEEYLVIMKTFGKHVRKIEQLLLEKHPYDTPEYVVTRAEHVTESYLAWMREGLL